VGSYSTFSPLPGAETDPGGLLFCGTFLEVSLTGRYPASCPAEPGLSSRSKPSDRLSRCDGWKLAAIVRSGDLEKRHGRLFGLIRGRAGLV